MVKVPLAYILMFSLDLGLEGYAHAYTLATVGQLLTMWVIIGACLCMCSSEQCPTVHRCLYPMQYLALCTNFCHSEIYCTGAWKKQHLQPQRWWHGHHQV